MARVFSCIRCGYCHLWMYYIEMVYRAIILWRWKITLITQQLLYAIMFSTRIATSVLFIEDDQPHEANEPKEPNEPNGPHELNRPNEPNDPNGPMTQMTQMSKMSKMSKMRKMRKMGKMRKMSQTSLMSIMSRMNQMSQMSQMSRTSPISQMSQISQISQISRMSQMTLPSNPAQGNLTTTPLALIPERHQSSPFLKHSKTVHSKIKDFQCKRGEYPVAQYMVLLKHTIEVHS